MQQGVTQSELARLLNVTEGAVRKALKANRISRLPGGLIDPIAAREAWGATTDPARTRVRTEPRTKAKVRTSGTDPAGDVQTTGDAREAVTLITRILSEEGLRDDGKGIDFGKVRTAEMILKTRQRHLDQAVQEGKLVDRVAAENAFFDEGRLVRDGLLAWPARIAIEAADEIQVDPRTGKVEPRSLTVVLDRYMKQYLSEMGEPEQLSLEKAK